MKLTNYFRIRFLILFMSFFCIMTFSLLKSGFCDNTVKNDSSIRVSVVSQLFNDEGRTISAVKEKIKLAAGDDADIVLLPMECVKTDGEAIPGTISNAIATEALKHGMYVIGNIREKENNKTFVTSFLCSPEGKITGKYRKSHKMPDEDMDLGDDLPVFETHFGPIAMRIGTDRCFVDIDHVYTAKGARIIFWSQMPEPVEDEYQQDMPSMGRAVDYNVFIACARYANGKKGYITNKYPPYCGMPIGRSYVINREGMRIACTARTGGGIATSVIPKSRLEKKGRGPSTKSAFSVITEPVKPLERPEYTKRKVRVTAIEDHLKINELLPKLDEAGRLGSDIVCTYEVVWVGITGRGVSQAKSDSMAIESNKALELVARKAKEHKMYILICGVIRKMEVNEALLFDRNGELVWRYQKVGTTYDAQIGGTETPVFDTDFGRIAVRICVDEWMCELDRSYFLKGAEILFVPTQSWGPDGIFRNFRDFSRAMDTGMFHVEATHHQSELVHRSLILEPTGIPVAQAEYYRRGSIVSAVIDLDHNRPRRYTREYTPHTPGGYLPEYQLDRMPKMENDLFDVIRAQRRPELYRILAPESN